MAVRVFDVEVHLDRVGQDRPRHIFGLLVPNPGGDLVVEDSPAVEVSGCPGQGLATGKGAGHGNSSGCKGIGA